MKQKKRLFNIVPFSVAVAFAVFTFTPAMAGVDESLSLKTSASLEVGLLHHRLTDKYPAWNGQFVRGIWHSDANNTWNAELVNAREFSDNGALVVVGNTHTYDKYWYSNIVISSSAAGLFFPRWKFDAALSRKWLSGLNLVTTVGFSIIEAKDEHSDQGLSLSATYYFETPWVLEGGVRVNNSQPGDVTSLSKYVACTYGGEKTQIMSLRYGFGVEAYQIIGVDAQISNFSSDVWTATWRKWLRTNQGFQLRAESYVNPSYRRQGIEASLFQEF